MHIRDYAIEKALLLGLLTDRHDAEEKLREYVMRSAFYHHERGNRRFGAYVFEVRNVENIDSPVLVDVSLFKRGITPCPDCHGTRTINLLHSPKPQPTSWVTCPTCSGLGEIDKVKR